MTTLAPPTRQRAALAVLLTASFTLAVDFSILNVALPTIGADVGFRLADLQWIATAFALCAAGLTLLMGRVADLAGRRRMFLLGMALLGAGSLLGGLATTPAVLLTARVAQGVATAIVVPAALALLLGTFPEGPARDRALGLNGALMAAGFTTGAVLGGLLTDLLSWRWAFFLNVPVAVLVLVVAPRVLAERPAEQRTRLDVPGAATVTLGLLALVFGLTRAASHGWTDGLTLFAFAAALVLLAAFVQVERRTAFPLVPLSVLRRRSVAIGNIAGALAFVTETSLVFLLTLYLQEVLGYSPLGAGLSFAVLGLGTVAGGLLGPRVIGRFGNRTAIVGGFVVQAVATLSLVFVSAAAASIWLVLAATFVGGVANLVVIVGFMVTATSGLPETEQGLATGLTTMSQQIGITLGTPVMSAVVTAVVLGGSGVLDGVTTAIAVNGGLCLLGAAVVAARLGGRSAPRR
ncbi:MFS transporter [Modestobacter sp. VKM Ac-2979]|uniref:MFS transporter n=1 Tax=unclassified Modestobacter TaxID=2643866 RepID=UPI0022ABAF68|nr:MULTISPECIES: MFS transporter [unclassified Modestobacter]MCZ2810108.1 MFS transporter [Modestobacter sp. VKM Ac-2979]MCZ2844739.1 MFS transporter [Modestobacter sp. VKM Ac-2980]